MNERIKLLAEQAQIRLFEDKSFGWSVIAGTDQHLEKFAELIVQECVGICEEMATKCAGLPGDGALAKDCANYIREDFGVKL